MCRESVGSPLQGFPSKAVFFSFFRAGRRQECRKVITHYNSISNFLIPTPWHHRQVLTTRSAEPRAPGRLVFPRELVSLCCGGRDGRGDTGKCELFISILSCV